MFYTFPRITNIDQVRAAISGREEFIEADKGSYIVFNYLVNFEDTFPNPYELFNTPLDGEKYLLNESYAIRRECRGLIFDKLTGRVIGRRYHKFFNLGEKEEVRAENIDWSVPYHVFEKLDGSMCSYLEVDGKPFWATKMMSPDFNILISEFVENSEIDYVGFSKILYDKGYTTIYEWCSRKSRIVVDYPEDRLVCTAIRENVTGKYLSYKDMKLVCSVYQIECVKTFDLTVESAKSTLSEIEDEGYVVRFENGHMTKMKGAHYLLLHKTMEHLVYEKDVLRLVLEDKLDDVKPYLPEDLHKKLDEYAENLYHNMRTTAYHIACQYINLYRTYGSSKKDFAMFVQTDYKHYSTFMFGLYKNGDLSVDSATECVYKLLKDLILKNTSSSGAVQKILPLINNLRWE